MKTVQYITARKIIFNPFRASQIKHVHQKINRVNIQRKSSLIISELREVPGLLPALFFR